MPTRCCRISVGHPPNFTQDASETKHKSSQCMPTRCCRISVGHPPNFTQDASETTITILSFTGFNQQLRHRGQLVNQISNQYVEETKPTYI